MTTTNICDIDDVVMNAKQDVLGESSPPEVRRGHELISFFVRRFRQVQVDQISVPRRPALVRDVDRLFGAVEQQQPVDER